MEHTLAEQCKPGPAEHHAFLEGAFEDHFPNETDDCFFKGIVTNL
jgi:hypothetical protein